MKPYAPPRLIATTVIDTADGRVLDEPAVDRLAHALRTDIAKHYPGGALVRVTLEPLR